MHVGLWSTTEPSMEPLWAWQGKKKKQKQQQSNRQTIKQTNKNEQDQY